MIKTLKIASIYTSHARYAWSINVKTICTFFMKNMKNYWCSLRIVNLAIFERCGT